MKFRLKEYPHLKDAVREMTVTELLKTVSCPQTTADNLDFPKGFQTVFLHGTTREKAKRFLEHYSQGAAFAPLICTDTECGAGMMIEGCTCFPSMGALGVWGDPQVAYQVGRITARDSLEAGYRWSLAPCVDIRMKAESPAVSIRAAGEDADTVMRIAGAYMEGLQDGGVVATIKHFPGDGATDYDQHLTTSVNPLSKEDWRDTYGRVYGDLIGRGAMCVMPGHIALPSFDEEDPVMGLCPPATLSYPLMTGLLKQELGFEGIICSDALTMDGFSGFMNYYEACATFLKNGGDMMLFVRTDDHFYEKMNSLVETGFLPLEVLRDRAYRVLCFLRQVQEMPICADALPEDQALAKQVVQKAITVKRDRFGLLPFRVDKNVKILVADISNDYAGTSCARDFYETLRQEGYEAELWENPGPSRLRRAAESGAYQLILGAVTNQFSFGTNVLRLHGKVARNMMEGWTKLGTPVVFLCFYDTSFHNQFAAAADTVVYTHGVAEDTHRELIKKILK